MIRSSSGSVRAAMSQRVPIPFSAATGEALACRRALVFAKEVSALDCIFEGEAEVLIKAIWMEDVHNPEYGHVIEDILVQLGTLTFVFSIMLKDQAIKLSIILARRSKSGCELQVCFDNIPEEIDPLVAFDAMYSP